MGIWLILLMLFVTVSGWTASLRVQWQAPTENTDGSLLTDLSGYRIHYGTAPGVYTTVVEAGLVTEIILSGLLQHTTYFVAATAYDHSGNDSVLSVEVSAVTGADPPMDITPPTVALISPTHGSVVDRKASVTVEAQAQDDTEVVGVEVFVNEALLCSRDVSPYRCTWKVPSPPNRTYTLQAQALDASSNLGISTQVQVTSH